ncbi:MAG TPA: TadE/TadG family type IV pilus assembly protein [Hyphomonadaceae bacterium]|nr:TadE/TadG family type IV pilus assembly protein [Hyphomonadaceae bacterium]
MKTPKHFAKAKEGTTLIEFALLAPVFFMLVMGLVEFVLFQYKTYALNHVVYEAARKLQTGEVQNSGDMANTFSDEVCAAAGPMIDCKQIVFDVRSFDEIEDISYPPVEFDDEGNPMNFVFEPGGPEKYSVIRASIHHQFITPFMDKLFRIGPDMPAIVNAYCVVRNEPWS